ncbi:putative membrane protein YdjX (TVP38/TMEM64 family) [Paenibacillus shirakamiensis]|uniref:TVP38/TMEM64 family membrane protein n=1 Tax=Paenibacillus shirakamiensis TaxID=1265935 RepID=A0ABS4JF73_9BACL|nr:TVP38/TMEM64 family protein [Paenibacillus shirakamiensis]MBP2000361.1 putative membrane protein YdjX (TVP38/TMEM64 family) [Paenibacillus shirakamiensis]
MIISDILSYITEDNLKLWLERFRALGPLPAIILPFLKSFVPPLPTLLIIGVNAAVYGLWLGFLYSWLGIVAGCVATFLIVRKIGHLPFLTRMSQKPKVERTRLWIQRNGFSYVFLLSLFPVGPFVIINIAGALSGMRLRTYLFAILVGKGIMCFTISWIGADVSKYLDHPLQILYIVLFVAVSLLITKRIEAWFTVRNQMTRVEEA